MIVLFLFCFQFLSYSQVCIEEETLDFTFYIESGNDDWMVSKKYPNETPGVVVGSLGNLSIILDDASLCDYYYATITKSFYLLAPASKARLYVKFDEQGSYN